MREKNIWTDEECRRASVGNENRSVARPCGWQTRRKLERIKPGYGQIKRADTPKMKNTSRNMVQKGSTL